MSRTFCSGCPGSTAKELAGQLLEDYGSLIGLSNVNPPFLKRRGIGEAKATTIVAAFEIARRVARERIPRRDLLDRPDSVASYLGLRYAMCYQKTMGALFFDVRNRLIAESEVYRGTLTRAAVEPRAIMKEALLHSASAFFSHHACPYVRGVGKRDALSGRHGGEVERREGLAVPR